MPDRKEPGCIATIVLGLFLAIVWKDIVAFLEKLFNAFNEAGFAFSRLLEDILWWVLVIIGSLVGLVIVGFIMLLIFRRDNLRRFKRWHIVTRIVAIFVKPDQLEDANTNIDTLKEIEAKMENKSLSRMAQELKAAEDDYKEALKRCNGSKAIEKEIKDAYAQKCARIKDKYKV